MFHVQDENGPCNTSFNGCKFISGGIGNIWLFNAASEGSFKNCITPNNAGVITGGNVRVVDCTDLFNKATSSFTSLRVDDHVSVLTDATVAEDFGRQLPIVSGTGAQSALILCSHSTGGGNASNSELFLIRIGRTSGAFSATSLGRDAGTDASTYSFADVGGFLSVTSDAGSARYMVVAHLADETTPAFG